MKYAIFYDTETSGLPDWSSPSESEHQPHIVQLAAAMVNLESRNIVQSMDVIIKPDDWAIPDDVSAIHGITTDHALEVGVSEQIALESFLNMCKPSMKRIAHNISFDDRIIRIAIMRFLSEEIADQYRAVETECTMNLATAIVKCPPTEKMLKAGRNYYKQASLGEAYKHFTGKDLEGAHNAMVDVQACIEVYFAIQDFECKAA